MQLFQIIAFLSRFLIAAIIASSFYSCSLLDSGEPSELDSSDLSLRADSSKMISSLRMYLAKGSFSSTEFEQFSLSGNALFFECGVIRHGKNIPDLQGVVRLKEASASEIILLGMEILGRAAKSDPLSLAEPGNLKGFVDSGRLALNLTTKDNKTAEINTGLNEVSEPLTAVERSLLKLAKSLRSEVKSAKGSDGLCGNDVFFGIN